eukprot:scaffold421334_cov62-Attheya_sp.AAC.1
MEIVVLISLNLDHCLDKPFDLLSACILVEVVDIPCSKDSRLQCDLAEAQPASARLKTETYNY